MVSLIIKQRSAIISRWFDSAIHAYATGHRRLHQKPERPVSPTPSAATPSRAWKSLFDQLVGGMDAGAITDSPGPHHADSRRAKFNTGSRHRFHLFPEKHPYRHVRQKSSGRRH
ncbi:MAG: hypothetical protein MZV70_18225 [Desulfobacterales bacterium]|nr:hypothetical protein [Desulfobacterales bacterium]